MQDEQELTQIEQYLNGTLPPEEAFAFTERMENDPDFAQKVAEYKNILAGIDEFGQDDFFNKMRSWENALAASEAETKTKEIPFKQYFARAAVVLLLLLPLGYWIVSQNSLSYTNEELFALYFEPYDDIISSRASGNTDMLAQGMEFYHNRNYSEAITYLEKYQTGTPDQPAVDFYLGVSYLATDQTENAEQFFKKVIAHGESAFVEVAEWNLALAYLKTEEHTHLKTKLHQIIAQPNHQFHAEAIELNERIN